MCGHTVFDGGSISSISGSCVGDGVCHSVGYGSGAVGAVEGPYVGYNTCYAVSRNSGVVGDVTVACGDGARVCGYTAA